MAHAPRSPPPVATSHVNCRGGHLRGGIFFSVQTVSVERELVRIGAAQVKIVLLNLHRLECAIAHCQQMALRALAHQQKFLMGGQPQRT